MTDNPMRPTETEHVSQACPMRSQDQVGGAMQVGARHRAAEVSNARWC